MGLYKRLNFLGNLLEKLTFLASKLRNGPLLEHGSLNEILRYLQHILLPEPLVLDPVYFVYVE